MDESNVMIKPVFEWGPLVITSTVVTTWVIMGLLWLLSWLLSRRLRVEPGPLQTAIESVVAAIENAIVAVAPDHGAGADTDGSRGNRQHH